MLLRLLIFMSVKTLNWDMFCFVLFFEQLSPIWGLEGSREDPFKVFA